MKLEVINCTKIYNDSNIALNHCSFSLESGIYALLGPNGSGKSTLMNLISTLISPTEGEILWNGVSISNNNDYLRKIGYMPQYPCLYEDFTLFEYLNYMGNIKGIKKEVLKERIIKVSHDVELETVINNKICTFSGGMKQRTMLAQALLNDPDLLILDEPTAGLDPLKRVEIQNLVSKLGRNKIIIFATHVVSDVEYIAKEFILLKKGEMICKSSRGDLCKQLDNYVYEKEVNEIEYQKLNELHRVSSIRFENNHLIARIVSEKKETEKTVVPSLTDVYLQVFHEELGDE